MSSSRSRGTAAFDWEQAKRRLRQLAEALEQHEHLSAEQARALMDERARALAHVPHEGDPGGDALEVVILLLAGERFAVETRYVREVFHAAAVTPVPGGPDFLLGVTNLRGEVLPVLDFHRLLQLGQARLDGPTRLVVFGEQRAEFGVPGDEIAEVTTLRGADMLPPESSLAGTLRELTRGVTQDGLIVLDGEIIMHDNRLIVDDATT